VGGAPTAGFRGIDIFPERERLENMHLGKRPYSFESISGKKFPRERER
jgi:hypothetical protein